MSWKDRVVLVTGGGSGFGAGIAEVFCQAGAQVAVVDLNPIGGEAVVTKLCADHGPNSAIFEQADVGNRESFQRVVDSVITHYGRLDAVVNNAGITNRNTPTLQIDEADIDQIFRVNVKSIWNSICAAVPVFRAQGEGGVFINIASTGAIRPRPGLALYNASKAAVVNLSKSLAVEFASDRIRVNAICPVAGETPLVEKFLGEDTPERRKAFEQSIPLGRFSQPVDIANAVIFLASNAAEFITGVSLEVDGGRCV